MLEANNTDDDIQIVFEMSGSRTSTQAEPSVAAGIVDPAELFQDRIRYKNQDYYGWPVKVAAAVGRTCGKDKVMLLPKRSVFKVNEKDVAKRKNKNPLRTRMTVKQLKQLIGQLSNDKSCTDSNEDHRNVSKTNPVPQQLDEAPSILYGNSSESSVAATSICMTKTMTPISANYCARQGVRPEGRFVPTGRQTTLALDIDRHFDVTDHYNMQRLLPMALMQTPPAHLPGAAENAAPPRFRALTSSAYQHQFAAPNAGAAETKGRGILEAAMDICSLNSPHIRALAFNQAEAGVNEWRVNSEDATLPIDVTETVRGRGAQRRPRGPTVYHLQRLQIGDFVVVSDSTGKCGGGLNRLKISFSRNCLIYEFEHDYTPKLKNDWLREPVAAPSFDQNACNAADASDGYTCEAMARVMWGAASPVHLTSTMVVQMDNIAAMQFFSDELWMKLKRSPRITSGVDISYLMDDSKVCPNEVTDIRDVTDGQKDLCLVHRLRFKSSGRSASKVYKLRDMLLADPADRFRPLMCDNLEDVLAAESFAPPPATPVDSGDAPLPPIAYWYNGEPPTRASSPAFQTPQQALWGDRTLSAFLPTYSVTDSPVFGADGAAPSEHLAPVEFNPFLEELGGYSEFGV